MPGRPTRTALEARVDSLCRDDEAGERPRRVALLEAIRSAVPFDAHAWLLTDPETEVGSSPVADVPDLSTLPTLVAAKYLTTVNRWTLVDGPVATLHEATGGALDRSRVWREAMATHQVVDVASVVYRDPHGCWGWLDLWRTAPALPFTAEERSRLASVAVPITRALRRAQARTFTDPTTATAAARPVGPAVLLLSPQLEVRAQTPDTDVHLRALIPTEGSARPIPAGAYNVAAQLLAVEEGVDDHPPSTRVALGGGRWVVLRAARVDRVEPAPRRDIAVTIEAASPAERRAVFTRSHGLSRRETDVVEQLATGADTRSIAATLFVSDHTVQDHLKAIYAKTGTHGRRALLARASG